MEGRETPRMHKYGESKTTRSVTATVRHVTSGEGLRKFQAASFLLNRVLMQIMFNNLSLNYTTINSQLLVGSDCGKKLLEGKHGSEATPATLLM